MSTTTNKYYAHPAAAAGISRASSGGVAWSYSAYTEVVPANAITVAYNLSGLTWAWHTPIAAADVTYEWIIEIASGAAAAEVLVAQFASSIRGDTLVGYVPSNVVILPEPVALAANTRLSVRVAYSLATTSNTLTGIKILYHRA